MIKALRVSPAVLLWSFKVAVKRVEHSLKEFDTRGLGNVRSIGACFLCDARSLKEFDSSGLGNVRVIGGSFLAGTKIKEPKALQLRLLIG